MRQHRRLHDDRLDPPAARLARSIEHAHHPRGEGSESGLLRYFEQTPGHDRMGMSRADATIADTIRCGDALSVLRELPTGSVDCIVTSPPYFRQRDYRGQRRQVGQEKSPEDYVARLAGVFGECRRVLKASGTVWLVLGDKYEELRQLGLPWRVALALVEQGWILRADCIWHKPNAMPSPARSRPTTDHEYVFFFANGPNYYYDADAIREPHVTFSENSRMRGGRRHFGVRGGTPENGKNA